MGMIDILKAELTNDPLTIGYSGMTDVQAADSLNDAGAGRTQTIDTLTAVEVYEIIDTSEFNALTSAQQASLDRILGLGGDIVFVNPSKARGVMTSLFAGGTDTRASMVAALSSSISRAQELGLGKVKPGHVEEARR